MSLDALHAVCTELFQAYEVTGRVAHQELTLEVPPKHLLEVCHKLKSEPKLAFELLLDICGVDYLYYGLDEWTTDAATSTGFERGVRSLYDLKTSDLKKEKRFAVVYHFLSTSLNQRIRLKTFVPHDTLLIESVTSIWSSANWYEREAFDLYGILFNNHPDLRRILTDYGFIGHPFRKDFPLSGNVEVRYDAQLGRVVYEPVDIQPRILVPKVIRKEE